MRKFRIWLSEKFRKFFHQSKTTTTIRKWITDPDLTFVGAGIIGSLTGRSVLFGSLAWSSMMLGLWGYAALLLAVITVDVFIHLQSLLAIKRLMASDALTYVFGSFKPTLVTV